MNVRDAMTLAGVSQYQLAAHLSISQASVSRRLTGSVDFGITELRSTADLLEVPVETLINAPLSALAEGATTSPAASAAGDPVDTSASVMGDMIDGGASEAACSAPGAPKISGTSHGRR